jgi:hypothetical protein
MCLFASTPQHIKATFPFEMTSSLSGLENARETFMDQSEGERMATLTTTNLLAHWQCDLAVNRAAATAGCLSAVPRFLGWYEDQERQPLQFDQLTPMTLVGYRSAPQRTEAIRIANTH